MKPCVPSQTPQKDKRKVSSHDSNENNKNKIYYKSISAGNKITQGDYAKISKATPSTQSFLMPRTCLGFPCTHLRWIRWLSSTSAVFFKIQEINHHKRSPSTHWTVYLIRTWKKWVSPQMGLSEYPFNLKLSLNLLCLIFSTWIQLVGGEHVVKSSFPGYISSNHILLYLIKL